MPTDTPTSPVTETPIQNADPSVKSFGAKPKKSSLAVNSIGEGKIARPLQLNQSGTAVPTPVAAKPAPKKVAAVAEETADVAEEATETETTTEAVETNADEIPAKLRGKSPSQLAAMYKNLESVKGRMANELGQMRQVLDELLSARAAPPTQKAKKAEDTDEPVTSDKLLSDPDKTISDKARKAVKKDLEDTSDRLSKLEYAKEAESFTRDFPDHAETQQDPDFLAFVQRSPYRAGLAKATFDGSFPAARELFGLWNEIKEAKTPKAEAKAKVEADVDAATTVRPGSSGPAMKPAKQAIANSKKKVWSKKEIRNLFMKNRAAYTRQFDEIKSAYADKRVVE